MDGKQQVEATFDRLFGDYTFRSSLRDAKDPDRALILREAGFAGRYTMDDVHQVARQVVQTGLPPGARPPPGQRWAPKPGETWEDAPIHMMQARRVAASFGAWVSPGATDFGRHWEPPPFKMSYVIAGVMKCGTTALDYFLSQHPDICTAEPKEALFFSRDFFFDPEPKYEWHYLNFEHYAGERAVGEATPAYSHDPDVISRLEDYNADLKLIVLLRNPIDRAYSEYRMWVDRGAVLGAAPGVRVETRSFLDAVRQEAKDWAEVGGDFRKLEAYQLPRVGVRADNSPLGQSSYLTNGFYMAAVKNLLRFFPREQMLFLRTEHLLRAHRETLLEVYDFLGVDPGHVPEPARKMEGSYSPLSTAERAEVAQLYTEEIDELETFLGWDLEAWRR